MRYERKIPIKGFEGWQIENIIKLHSQCFNEIFFQRKVNNIYFDDLDKSAFRDNIEGSDKRVKCRMRWYGDTFGVIEPTLELKIKKGLVGYKRSFKLNNFTFLSNTKTSEIRSFIFSNDIPNDIYEMLKVSYPMLYNSYLRKYYLSFDKKYRVTLDKKLEYAKYDKTISFRNSIDPNLIVLEIKYDIENDHQAKSILGEFPFRLDKNSKFAKGMELSQF